MKNRNILFDRFIKVIFTLTIVLLGNSSYAQEDCDLTVQVVEEASGTTCGASVFLDGNLLNLSGGTATSCTTPETSPKSCAAMESGAIESTQQNGDLILENGQIIYLTSDFQGNLMLRNGGGVLVICGNAMFQNIQTNNNDNAPVDIYVNGGATLMNSNLNLAPYINIWNYGTINTISAGFNGSFYNHGDFTVNGSFDFNSQSGIFLNAKNITVSSSFNVDATASLTNNGVIDVGVDFKVNGGGLFTNNCTITTGAEFHQNNVFNNNGYVEVGTSLVNNSGGILTMGSASKIKMASISLGSNGVINGIGSECAGIEITNNTLIHGNVTGNVGVCYGSGNFTVTGTIANTVSTDCSCPALNGNGPTTITSSGTTGTVVWSSGTVTNSGVSVTGLVEGSYTVTVDLENCDSEVLTFTVGPKDEDCDLSVEVTHETLGDDGSAELFLDGVLVDLSNTTGSFIWSAGIVADGGTTVSDLPAGTYTVTVDLDECLSETISFTIDPKEVVVTAGCESIEVKTKAPACSYTSDGSAEICYNGVGLRTTTGGTGFGNCVEPETSPMDCSAMEAGSIENTSTSGEILITGGQVVYLTSDFSGDLKFEQGNGKIIICGDVNIVNLNVNDQQAPIEIYINGGLNVSASYLDLKNNVKLFNYGTFSVNTSGLNGELYNHGTLDVKYDFNINSSSAQFYNSDSVHVGQSFNINTSDLVVNDGNIVINNIFQNNGEGDFKNNCRLIVGNNFLQNSKFENNGFVSVTNTFTINGGVNVLNSGSIFETKDLQINGGVNLQGLGSECSALKVTNNAINHGQITGLIDLCLGTGNFTNTGTVAATVSTDCACNATGNMASSGGTGETTTATTLTTSDGLNVIVTWPSSGTVILGGSKITGLAPGTYTVDIEVEGCETKTITFTIPPSPPVLTVAATIDASNVATVTAQGGTGVTFEYVWEDLTQTGANVITRDLSNVLSGTYCVTVKDVNECISEMEACVIVHNDTTPDTTGVICVTEEEILITIEIKNPDECLWEIVAPDGTTTEKYTFNKPCYDSIVTIVSCENKLISNNYTIPGTGGICTTTGTCPNVNNPNCPKDSVCPDPLNPACDPEDECINTEGIDYTLVEKGVIQFSLSSGVPWNHSTYNNRTPQTGTSEFIEGLSVGTTEFTITNIASGEKSCLDVLLSEIDGDPCSDGSITIPCPKDTVKTTLDSCKITAIAPEGYIAPISYTWMNPANDNEVLATTETYQLGAEPLFGKPKYLKIEVKDGSNSVICEVDIPAQCYNTDCHPLDVLCDTTTTRPDTLGVTYEETLGACIAPMLPEYSIVFTVTGGSGSYRIHVVEGLDDDAGNKVYSFPSLSIDGFQAGQKYHVTVFDQIKSLEKTIVVDLPSLPRSVINLVNNSDPITTINTGFTLEVTDDLSGPYSIDLSSISGGVFTNQTIANGNLGTYNLPTDQGNGPFKIIVTDIHCQEYVFNVYRSTVVCATVSYVPNVESVQPTCKGGTDGSLSITNLPLPTGATVLWSSTTSTFTSTQTSISNLSAGTYVLAIEDEANACFVVLPQEEILQDGGEKEAFTSTTSSCKEEIKVFSRDASGVQTLLDPAGFTYRWTNPEFEGDNPIATTQELDLSTITLTKIPNYLNIEVRDANGDFVASGTHQPVICIKEELCPYNITYTPENPSCDEGQDGSIQVNNVQNGFIEWIDLPQGANRVTQRNNLSAGEYTFDAFIIGCAEPQRTTITLQNPPSIEATIVLHDDQTLRIEAASGTAPYTYKWADEDVSRLQADNLKTDLVDGTTYDVIVTDANLCTKEDTYTYNPCAVSKPEPLVIHKDFRVDGEGDPNSTSEAIANGGTGPYTYLWTRKDGGALTNNTDKIQVDLPERTYVLIITDKFDCKGETEFDPSACEEEILVEAEVVETDATQCNLCDGEAHIEFAEGIDLSDYTILWDELDITEVLSQEGGLAVLKMRSNIQILNACPGTHEVVTIKEGSNCPVYERNVVIGCVDTPPVCENTDLKIVNGPTEFTKLCDEDEDVFIDVKVTGGRAAYTYNWYFTGEAQDEVQFPASNVQPGFMNPNPGQYRLVVVDADGCDVEKTYTVNSPAEALSATHTFEDPNCVNGTGSAIVTPTGGTSPYTVTWDHDDFIGAARTDLPENNTYTYIVTDKNECDPYIGTVTIGRVFYNGLTNNEDNTGTLDLCTEDPNLTITVPLQQGYDYVWTSDQFEGEKKVRRLSVTSRGVYTLTRNSLVTEYNCPSIVETIIVDTVTCPTFNITCFDETYSIPDAVDVDVCELTARFTAAAKGRKLYLDYLEEVKQNFKNDYRRSVIASVDEKLFVDFEDDEQQYTLYYYDQAGNLTRTVPPEGIRTLSKDQAGELEAYWNSLSSTVNTDGETVTTASLPQPNIHTEHTLATTYRYNSLNQLTSQDVPDNDAQDLWESSLRKTLNYDVSTLSSSSNTVLAFANDNDRTYLYTSTDAGVTYTDGLTLNLGDVNDFDYITSGSAQLFYAVGSEGLILQSSNMGQTWKLLPSPNKENYVKVLFESGNTGYIITDEGKMLRTLDGGNNWTIDVVTSVEINDETGVTTETLSEFFVDKTITDITDIDDRLYVTGYEGNEGFVYVSVEDDLTSFVRVEADIPPIIDAIAYDGQSTFALSENILFEVIDGEYVYRNEVSGFSGTIQSFNMNQDISVIKTDQDIYWSTNNTTFQRLNDIFPNNLNVVQSDDRIALQNGTGLVIFQNSTPTLVIQPNIKQFLKADDGSSWVLLDDNQRVRNINTGVTYNVSVDNSVQGDLGFVETGGVFIFKTNNSLISLRLTSNGFVNLSTLSVSANISNFHKVGSSIIAEDHSRNYYAITVNSTTGEMTIASIPMPGKLYNDLVEVISGTDYFYTTISYPAPESKPKSALNSYTSGNQPTIVALREGLTYATTKGDNNTLYTTSTTGIIYKHAASNPLMMEFVKTNISDDLLEASNFNNSLRVASSTAVYGYNASNQTMTEQFATDNVISMSGNYVLNKDGEVFEGTSGTATDVLLNYNVLDTENSVALAGGDNADISRNPNGSGWLEAGGLEIEPIQATSFEGSIVLAVGDEGTIIKSEDDGATFDIIQGTATNQLTAVAIRETGFVVGDELGNIIHYANGIDGVIASLPTNSATSRMEITKIVVNDAHATNSVWVLRGREVLYSASGNNFTIAFTSPEMLNDIVFADEDHGFLIGNDGTAYRILPTGVVEEGELTLEEKTEIQGPGAIASITNTEVSFVEGKSLKQIETDTDLRDDQGTNLSPAHLIETIFYDKLEGYITLSGMVLKTIDGGYHWTLEGAYNGTPLLTQISRENNAYGDNNNLGTVRDRALSITSRFWYDELGRLVLSQNARQFNIEDYLSEHQYQEVVLPTPEDAEYANDRIRAYSYTLYDDIGRITEVGELLTQKPLTTHKYETQVRYAIHQGEFVPAGARVQVSKTYYDRAAFTGLTTDGFSQTNLRPRVASVTYQQYENRAGDMRYDRATHYSYDVHGNVKTLLQEIRRVDQNEIGFVEPIFKRVDYEYDLISGNVNYVHFQRGKNDAFSHKYTYDGDNRIDTVLTSTDEIIWNKEADYDYYAHGPLARVRTGREGEEVDQCDFAYTIHGWIKGVQSQNFSYALGYYADDEDNIDYTSIGTASLEATPMATNLYNGNISTMSTHTPAFVKNNQQTSFTKQFTYDQLNRIKTGTVTNAQGGAFSTGYSYDANGNIETLTRKDDGGNTFDEFAYHYHNVNEGYLRNTNRLRWVDDAIEDETLHPDDIEDQDRDNYSYDELGNLLSDEAEEIDHIEWTAAGKVHAVIRKEGSTKTDLYFSYDAMGNRISKKSKDPSTNVIKTTYYFREASGNTMAIYQSTNTTSFKPTEYHLYGSSRCGIFKPRDQEGLGNGADFINTPNLISTLGETSRGSNYIGNRNYELKDHLGNVHLVLSDLLPTDNTDFSNVQAAYEYYPFGMAMQTFEDGGYRYGFQGQEKDDEVKGQGNSYAFKYRIHDVRLGRFLSIDPLSGKYPFFSPYQFSGNRVYDAFELEGLEYILRKHYYDEQGKKIKTLDFLYYKYNDEKIEALNGSTAGVYNAGSHGSRGEGVLHQYYDYEGEKVHERWDMPRDNPTQRTGAHGIYSGPSASTLANGNFDFTFQPVDVADAIAKIHDMAYSQFNDKENWQGFVEDIRTLDADLHMLKQIEEYTVENVGWKGLGIEEPVRTTASGEMASAMLGQQTMISALASYKSWKAGQPNNGKDLNIFDNADDYIAAAGDLDSMNPVVQYEIQARKVAVLLLQKAETTRKSVSNKKETEQKEIKEKLIH